MSRAATGNGGGPAWVVQARFAVEVAGTMLLAALLARLVWAGFPPLVEGAPTINAAAPARFAAPSDIAGLNPFRGGATAAPAVDPLTDAPATALNLALVGVRSARGGEAGAGAAIIQTPDNGQRLYRVGDAIVAGVTLEAVEADRVVIRRDGALESVLFTARGGVIGAGRGTSVAQASRDAPAEAPPPTVLSGGPVAIAALLNDVAVVSRAESGVVLVPSGDGEAFAAAGLQPYDVVLSVNGASPDGI
jgi:general secretion pathway protein C